MTTTIRVSTEIRDRLKRQARAQNRTLGEHLAHLADLRDRADRVEALRGAIARTPPAERTDYERETAEWERTELADGTNP